MKATDYLKAQHREVEQLFSRLEQAEGTKKQKLFEELAANLVGHDAIEREIFYPACEDQMGINDVMGEALVEHGLVEFSLLRADENLGSEYFDYFISVLKENVQHHVKEEEEQLLPRISEALEADALEALGAKMEARFKKLRASDWRAPLVENVREVMTGALKTGNENVEEIEAQRASAKPKAPSRATAKSRSKSSSHRAHR